MPHVVFLSFSHVVDAWGGQGVRCNAVCPGDCFVERWTREGYFGNGHGGPLSEAKVSPVNSF